MRVRVAGISIDVRGSTWFKTFYGAWPIYHAWGSPGKTRCGLVIFRDQREVATPLPPRFGVRIGRPCCRCWPELANQRSLFKRPAGPGTTTTQEEIHA